MGDYRIKAIQNMQEAVYIRDVDMNILYLNPAAESLSGPRRGTVNLTFWNRSLSIGEGK